MAALVLPLLTEAAVEKTTTFVWTNTIPFTIEDHKLFKTTWIHHQDTS